MDFSTLNSSVCVFSTTTMSVFSSLVGPVKETNTETLMLAVAYYGYGTRLDYADMGSILLLLLLQQNKLSATSWS